MNGKNRDKKILPPRPIQGNLLCPKAMCKKEKEGEKLRKGIR
jgi:hypothetical protein